MTTTDLLIALTLFGFIWGIFIFLLWFVYRNRNNFARREVPDVKAKLTVLFFLLNLGSVVTVYVFLRTNTDLLPLTILYTIIALGLCGIIYLVYQIHPTAHGG
jgi:FtsH-binding integral membrane protein